MIASTQNPRIKNLVKLSKARERREQGLFVIEGYRELSLAIKFGYAIHSLFICEDIIDPENLQAIRHIGIPYETIGHSVFEKIAYREHSGGVIAVAVHKDISVGEIRLTANPLIIVLEAVEKPGNLGAILRTADAASVDAVIVCDPQTDVYNPNTIRSSIGCVFTKQVVTCTSEEACRWLKQQGITVLAAELMASQWYHRVEYTCPTAVVFGTEADGLTGFWLENADQRIKIPMLGSIDSLNVAVSAAVITFEAMRQRNFKS